MIKVVLGIVLGGVFFLTNQALACATMGRGYTDYYYVSYSETTLIVFVICAFLVGLLIGLLVGRKAVSCCGGTVKKTIKK